MAELSLARVLALLDESKRRSNASKNKWFDGYDWHPGKPPASAIGKFDGKAGTTRRYMKEHSVVAYTTK